MENPNDVIASVASALAAFSEGPTSGSNTLKSLNDAERDGPGTGLFFESVTTTDKYIAVSDEEESFESSGSGTDESEEQCQSQKNYSHWRPTCSSGSSSDSFSEGERPRATAAMSKGPLRPSDDRQTPMGLSPFPASNRPSVRPTSGVGGAAPLHPPQSLYSRELSEAALALSWGRGPSDVISALATQPGSALASESSWDWTDADGGQNLGLPHGEHRPSGGNERKPRKLQPGYFDLESSPIRRPVAPRVSALPGLRAAATPTGLARSPSALGEVASHPLADVRGHAVTRVGGRLRNNHGPPWVAELGDSTGPKTIQYDVLGEPQGRLPDSPSGPAFFINQSEWQADTSKVDRALTGSAKGAMGYGLSSSVTLASGRSGPVGLHNAGTSNGELLAPAFVEATECSGANGGDGALKSSSRRAGGRRQTRRSSFTGALSATAAPPSLHAEATAAPVATILPPGERAMWLVDRVRQGTSGPAIADCTALASRVVPDGIRARGAGFKVEGGSAPMCDPSAVSSGAVKRRRYGVVVPLADSTDATVGPSNDSSDSPPSTALSVAQGDSLLAVPATAPAIGLITHANGVDGIVDAHAVPDNLVALVESTQTHAQNAHVPVDTGALETDSLLHPDGNDSRLELPAVPLLLGSGAPAAALSTEPMEPHYRSRRAVKRPSLKKSYDEDAFISDAEGADSASRPARAGDTRARASRADRGHVAVHAPGPESLHAQKRPWTAAEDAALCEALASVVEGGEGGPPV